MNYFIDLYKDISPNKLQINSATEEYLSLIFDKTETTLKNNSDLHAVIAYKENIPVGFATFGLLEDPTKLLIRTIPIAVEYKSIEQDIRLECMQYACKKFPTAQHIILMVRKANKAHELLCMKAGFERDEKVFTSSSYIRQTYDNQCYNGYSVLTSSMKDKI